MPTAWPALWKVLGVVLISDSTIGLNTEGNDQFFPLEPPESAVVPPPSLPQH